MKTINLIAILFLSVITSLHAGSFEIKVKDFDSSDIDKNADELMEDLEYFLEKPLNWCKVKPSGEINVMHQTATTSRIKMGFEIKCDHGDARRKLKKFWNKYENFLYRYETLIDNRIERMYPDYQLRWGLAINNYMFIQLYNLDAFGGSLGTYNCNVFFRLKFGEDYETIPFRINMPGNTLTVIPSNTIPDRTHYVYYFTFNIPTEILTSGKVDMDIERVWHLVNREKFIKGSQY